MTSADRMEIRTIIKFCSDLGKTPTETLKMMHTTTRHKDVKRALVFKWHKRFSDGRSSIDDDRGRGRKRIISGNVISLIQEALDVDRRLTVKALSGLVHGHLF